MSDDDDAAEAAARLESALERIARHAGRAPAQAAPAVAMTGESVDTAAIAARLDALISQVRGALEP